MLLHGLERVGNLFFLIQTTHKTKVWAIIRPMMSAEFAAKVKFVNGKEAIREYYPNPEALPECMGGKLDINKQLAEFILLRYKVEGLDPNAPYPTQAEAAAMAGEATMKANE